MKYVDQDPMEFCLEYNIKVEPRNHCIFVRHGVVEVSEIRASRLQINGTCRSSK